MEMIWIVVCLLACVVCIVGGYFIAHKRYLKQFGSLNELKQQYNEWQSKLSTLQNELWDLTKRSESHQQETRQIIAKAHQEAEEYKQQAQNRIEKYKTSRDKADEALKKLKIAIDDKKEQLAKLNNQTADLQKMQSERQLIEQSYAKLPDKQQQIDNLTMQLEQLKSELALYSDMDSYIEYGFYPLPKYGEASSRAYNEKLKQIRAEQKNMIKTSTAYNFPSDIEITGFDDYDKKLANNQGRLLITAFNSECDYLISKVSSKNFEATMTKIEKLAEQLEKRLVSLEIGISIEYVELKMQECTVYYQYICQKEAEAEEQREIRAQIREEAAAQREIERAIREAEKEEQMLQQAMEIARRELENASEEQRLVYEARLKELSEKLAEAESKEARAISMAQQTRRGHVYIISNIGSFGEDIYKIGMTRRLEPLERVHELGDASVPFAFDVHAMILSDDAPALEKELHEYFADASVNKVNKRKEFFDISLKDIRQYLENKGIETKWTMTAEATEYRQSLVIAEQAMQTVA